MERWRSNRHMSVFWVMRPGFTYASRMACTSSELSSCLKGLREAACVMDLGSWNDLSVLSVDILRSLDHFSAQALILENCFKICWWQVAPRQLWPWLRRVFSHPRFSVGARTSLEVPFLPTAQEQWGITECRWLNQTNIRNCIHTCVITQIFVYNIYIDIFGGKQEERCRWSSSPWRPL